MCVCPFLGFVYHFIVCLKDKPYALSLSQLLLGHHPEEIKQMCKMNEGINDPSCLILIRTPAAEFMDQLLGFQIMET